MTDMEIVCNLIFLLINFMCCILIFAVVQGGLMLKSFNQTVKSKRKKNSIKYIQ